MSERNKTWIFCMVMAAMAAFIVFGVKSTDHAKKIDAGKAIEEKLTEPQVEHAYCLGRCKPYKVIAVTWGRYSQCVCEVPSAPSTEVLEFRKYLDMIGQ